MKKLLLVAVLLVAAGLAAGAAAQNVIDNPLGTGEVKTVITRIADFLTAIAGAIATIVILYAGYLYLTGGGNPNQIEQARKALTWAIVGFAIILVARGIAALIENILTVRT